MKDDIYFISDSHLTKLLYQRLPKAAHDSANALMSVVRYIGEKGAAAVVFCGDNLDKKSPTPEDLRDLQFAVDFLCDADIPVYGIEGNHDKVAARHLDSTATGWLDLVQGMRRLSPDACVDINGITIRGLDFVQGKRVYDELESIGECDILVLHQPLDHLSGMEPNTITLEGIPDNVAKAVVCGHVHTPVMKTTESGVVVVSPGATHAQSASDPRGTFVRMTKDFEFEYIPTPRHREMAWRIIADSADIEELESYCDEHGASDDCEKPIVGGAYAQRLSEELNALREKYRDKVFFVLKMLSQDVSADDESELAVCPEDIVDKLMRDMELDKREYASELRDLALTAVSSSVEDLMAALDKKEKEDGL